MPNLIVPVTYVQLKIGRNRTGKHVIIGKIRDGIYNKFGGEMNDCIGSKIYVIHDGPDIIYVGHTTQKVGSRLTQSQNSKYPYHWLCELYPELELSVFKFELPMDCDSQKYYGEGIEAELVHIVRRDDGHWPFGQSEIHFNNIYPETTIMEAERIYAYFQTLRKADAPSTSPAPAAAPLNQNTP
jgi:hypothetical protein